MLRAQLRKRSEETRAAVITSSTYCLRNSLLFAPEVRLEISNNPLDRFLIKCLRLSFVGVLLGKELESHYPTRFVYRVGRIRVGACVSRIVRLDEIIALTC